MTKRRLTAWAAIGAATALVLAGCAGEPADDGGDDDATGAGVLTIASIPNYEPSLPQVIEAFEAEYPDIEVEIEFVEVGALHTQIRTQLSAGTAPDIFTAYPGNGTPTAMEVLVPEGFLMDMSDLELNDRIPSGMDAVTTVDGGRYILPLALGAIGGIYNETALADTGLTPPQTWSELLQFCDDARSAGKVAFAYAAQTGWNNQLHVFPLSATLVHGANPSFTEQQRSGAATFSDTPAWTEVFERVLEMQDSGCFQDAPLGTAYEGAIELVATGQAIAISSVSSTFGALAAAAPEETVFSFHALPATDNPNDTWISAGGSGGYAINAEAKNPVAAKLFMEFLATDEIMALIAEAQGAPPSIVGPSYQVPENLANIFTYVDAGKIHPYNDQLWPNPRVAEALIEGVQQLIGGNASVQDVLTSMDAAYAEG